LRRIWFPSAISRTQKIESLQDQAGQIILKTKVSFPKSAQNLDGILLMNFLTDSVLIILIDLMNFRLTGYAKLYSLTTNSECVEWKYVNYMKIIFQSIGLDHLNTTIYVLIKTYLSVFSVKQFKIRNYLGDCK
jgi:hypothetical protein